ncbi:MAG TPA: response regulator [Chitinophagaceae bacterium]
MTDKPLTQSYPIAQSQKLSALIIDDESDTCYLLSNILKQKNIQTVLAGSLTEAEKLLKTHPDFSIIFLDNRLPDGLGISYIHRFKKKFPATSIIMISAHDSNFDRQFAKKSGADFFLGKPFSKESILRTIENLQA